MAEPTVSNDANHLPPLIDLNSLLHQPPLVKQCVRCMNHLGALTKTKHCKDCLNKDSARKQNISVDSLLQKRALANQEQADLKLKDLARPTPPEGSHFCHDCKKDVDITLFDLTKSVARCRAHFAQATARKEAAVEKKKAVVPSSSAAAAAPTVTEVDFVERKIFNTLEAALEYVEVRGHEEHVMYLEYASDEFGCHRFRCHCFGAPVAPVAAFGNAPAAVRFNAAGLQVSF
jgi:hypothetical protein